MDSTPTARHQARAVRGLVLALSVALAATLLLVAPSGASRAPAVATSPASIGLPADALSTTGSARTTGLLPLRAADRYVPPQGAKFNHWNIKRYRNTIRSHMLRTINSVPRGATIRWMVFSFGD